MMDPVSIKEDSTEENKIEELLNRAVILFRKTGLIELANKWDRILKTYNSKKTIG